MKKEDCGFLVLTFDNQLLDNCIKSIRQYYESINIYIIDNNINNKKPSIADNENIYYYKNTSNGFAWGAFKSALKVFPSVKKWIFIHNNYILLDYFPEFIFKDDYVPFYSCNVINFCFLLPWMENKCKELSIHFEYNQNWNTSNGCLCSINSNILHKLFSLGLDKIHSNCKVEAVGQEIFFGFIINKILKIPIKNKLHDYDIRKNIVGIKPWKYIKYVRGGQGLKGLNSFFYNNGQMKKYIIDYNLIKPIIDKYNSIISNNMSRNEHFIILFKLFENNNINVLNQIRNQYPCYNLHLINYNEANKSFLEQLLSPIFMRLCYAKSYIKEAYYIEYNKIINREKIIYTS